jgi:hypothetical protein
MVSPKKLRPSIVAPESSRYVMLLGTRLRVNFANCWEQRVVVSSNEKLMLVRHGVEPTEDVSVIVQGPLSGEITGMHEHISRGHLEPAMKHVRIGEGDDTHSQLWQPARLRYSTGSVAKSRNVR